MGHLLSYWSLAPRGLGISHDEEDGEAGIGNSLERRPEDMAGGRASLWNAECGPHVSPFAEDGSLGSDRVSPQRWVLASCHPEVLL